MSQYENYIVMSIDVPNCSANYNKKILHVHQGGFQMKKVLPIILLFLIVFLLVGCGEDYKLALETPTNVSVQDGVVTWNAVEDATEYVVVVGTQSFTVTTTTLDLNQLGLASGTYAIHVVAKNGTDLSLPSTSVNYVAVNANYDSLYTQILALIDPTFEPEMVKEDFNDEWEYTNYEHMSALANVYAQTALNLNMPEADAVGMFTHVKTLPNRMDEVNDVYSLQDEIDSLFDFELTSVEMATMLVELAIVGIQIAIDDLEDRAADRPAEIASLQAEISSFVLDSDAQTVYNSLMLYASPEELEMLETFFDAEYDNLYYVLWTIESIAYDMLYNDGFYDADAYLLSDDPYIVLFYNLLLEAKLANDTVVHQLFMTGYPLQSLENLYQMKQSIGYYTEEMERDAENLLNLAELLVFVTTEKQMVLDSVEGVIEYVTLVYDTIPSTVFSLLDDMSESGELTIEEYFILKNEIVNVLQTTLPSIEDFENMYVMLFHVAQIMGDVDMTEMMNYANFFAEVQYYSIDLELALIDDIDQLMIEDIVAITDGMVIPGEMIFDEEYEYWYQEQDNVDFPKTIELIVYIGQYLEDFVAQNETKVQNLEDLIGSDSVEELLNIGADNLLTVLEGELEPDDYEMAYLLINELVADYDNIKAGLNVIKDTGIIMIDQFLVTEGRLFIDIHELMTVGSGDLTDTLFVQDLESIISLVVEYNNLLTGEVNLANIETLLRAIRVPLKYAIVSSNPDITYAEFDALFETIVGDIATVISNISSLEQQMINSLDALDISILLLDGNWNLEPDDMMFGVLVLAMDSAMTTAYEDLFFTTLDIISDEIMKNTTTLELTELLASDVDALFDSLEEQYIQLFLDIHQVADYDFTALTQVQIDQLIGLFENSIPIVDEIQPVVN